VTPGGALRRIVSACLVALCLSLALIGTSASAATTYVDGISDQHLANWEGGVSNLFANAWVGSPPAHIKLARYVVQWNVKVGGGYTNELANFRNWYERAGGLGLTREVALANYTGTAPSSATYQSELTSLLNEFMGIRIVEAWNEPNHRSTHVNFYVSPAGAAHYMNSAYSVCQSHNCTAIAGDFHDKEEMPKYEEEYKAMLNPSDPGNWAIHPYGAVLSHSTAPVSEFVAKLPSPGTDHVWFTEIGAYYCQAGESSPRGEAAQASDATWLVNTLIPQTANLEHVFYYEYAFEGTARINCSTSEDTELYAPPSTGQPNQPRSAASIVFGPEGPPTATTGPPSGLQPLQATISGSVNPQGIDDAKYYFQYGTTTSYGSSTPQGDAGQSLNSIPESATLTGIQPGTLYHYRIVATSAAGTGYGSDQVFTTPGPVEAVTGVATSVQQTQATLNGTVNPRGYDAKYSFEYGTSTAYGSGTTEGDAGSGNGGVEVSSVIAGLQPGVIYHYRIYAASGGVNSFGHDHTFTTQELENSSSWAIRNPITTEQWLYYRGNNGHVCGLNFNGGWVSDCEEGEIVAAGTSPTVVRDPSTGNQWVYYHGTNNQICGLAFETSWQQPGCIGGQPTSEASPTVIRDPVTSEQWIYYQGSGGVWGMSFYSGSWHVGKELL
jgi:hypothetical protein